MNTNQLSQALGNIRTDYIHDALMYHHCKAKYRWLKIGAAAACLFLVLLCGIFAGSKSKTFNEVHFSPNDIENLSAMYDGTILVDHLPLGNATDSQVTLCYSGTDSDYEDADWKSLSVSAEYGDYSVVMNCAFEKPTEPDPDATLFDTRTYGDITVYLYQSEATADRPSYYQAYFAYADIYYSLTTYSADSDCIYSLLDSVIGTSVPQGSNATAFSGILGYDGYRVRVEESTPGLYVWHYYAIIDGIDTCIAEMGGYLIPNEEPDSHSIDLDQDGITELICNYTAGTGAKGVVIFRNNNGIIEEGRIDQNYLIEECGFSILGTGAIQERYDRESNTFVITNTLSDGSETTVVLDNLDCFEFLPFISDEMMQANSATHSS